MGYEIKRTRIEQDIANEDELGEEICFGVVWVDGDSERGAVFIEQGSYKHSIWLTTKQAIQLREILEVVE